MESATSVEIRRAIAGDASDLARMRADSALERKGGGATKRDAYERTCAEFFSTILADPKSFLRTWVAVSDGRCVGAASLAVFPTLPRFIDESTSGFDGRVRDVYVQPEFRRRGIARLLMEAVMSEARALRVDRLSLGASSQGRPMYEKLGFVGKTDEMIFET